MSAGDSRPPSDDSAPSSSTAERSETTHGGRANEDESIVSRFLHADSGPLLFVRETLTSVAAVAAIGLLLFAVSGVWPPMVAVESGSMQPHMERGDLIFITEPGRFAPGAAYEDTGVVPYAQAEEAGYRSFGDYGSVIIYDDPSSYGPPIIHRARFWVNDSENWYEKANESYIRADNCEELTNCPAPHAGFVTKGDNNARYDQANGIAAPVRPEWVDGVARVRVPYLGCIRLGLGENSCLSPGSTVQNVEPTADPSVGVAAPTGSRSPSVSARAPGVAAAAPEPAVAASNLQEPNSTARAVRDRGAV